MFGENIKKTESRKEKFAQLNTINGADVDGLFETFGRIFGKSNPVNNKSTVKCVCPRMIEILVIIIVQVWNYATKC